MLILARDQYYSHYEPTWKEELHENSRHSLEIDHVEFVDPQLLHNSFPYTELGSSGKLEAPLDKMDDAAYFTRRQQYSPVVNSHTQKGLAEQEIPNSTPGKIFSDNWNISSTVVGISASNFDRGDYGDSSGDRDHSTTNFGFAIKSGWSSTFLHLEETENLNGGDIEW
jgi:hypothetical protein